MPRWLFRLIIVIFFLALVWIGYDITSRTTFPGSKGQLGERIRKQLSVGKDSASFPIDTLKSPDK